MKLVLFREIAFRHMEYMVVFEKIPGFDSDPRRRAWGKRVSWVLAPMKLSDSSEKKTQDTNKLT